jgi:hypothetical protein
MKRQWGLGDLGTWGLGNHRLSLPVGRQGLSVGRQARGEEDERDCSDEREDSKCRILRGGVPLGGG